MTNKPIKVFYLLVVTLVLLLWVEQRSINAYWVQTYHKGSPLTIFDQYSWWTKGGEVAAFLDSKLAVIQEQLVELNDEVVIALNEKWIDTSVKNISENTARYPLQLHINVKELYQPKQWMIFPKIPLITIAPEMQEEVLLPTASLLVVKKQVIDTGKILPVDDGMPFLIEKGQKVFFVGDSLMQGVAPHVMRILLKEHGIESINLSKQSTGLSYPKFFNWPQVAKDTFDKNVNIKLMIVFMGPNDPWDFPVGKSHKFFKFATPEWEGVYRARIQRLINVATSHGAKVLWIGIPNMREPKLNMGVIKLNKIYQSQVTIAHQYYIPSNDVLGMMDDTFVKFMKVPDRGNVTLRSDDGVHFTIIGQKLIASKIVSLLRFTDIREATE